MARIVAAEEAGRYRVDVVDPVEAERLYAPEVAAVALKPHFRTGEVAETSAPETHALDFARPSYGGEASVEVGRRIVERVDVVVRRYRPAPAAYFLEKFAQRVLAACRGVDGEVRGIGTVVAVLYPPDERDPAVRHSSRACG